MRAWAAIAVTMLVLMATPARAEIEVHATADKARVAVGDRFTLIVEVKGTRKAAALNIAGNDAFDVGFIGSTTHYANENGAVSTSVGHRYSLTARKPGRFTLGPFEVRVDGTVYKSAPLVVEVGKPADGQKSATVQRGTVTRLAVIPEKTSIYVGERVPLKVKLSIAGARDDRVRSLDGLGDGIVLEEFAGPARSSERLGGRVFRVLEYRTHFTVLAAGPLTLGPATMEFSVVEDRAQRGAGDLLDMNFGFGFNFGRRRNMRARAKAVDLEVKPLPTEGRPHDYSGAIGQFRFSVTATPTELEAGDPVTVRMEIRGVGNLTRVTPPSVPASDSLRVYDPLPLKAEAQPGRIAVEQVVIPKHAGVEALPPLRFTFFEPESGRYRTITRGPIALEVAAASGVAAPEVIGEAARAGRREPRAPLGRDIVYIKDRPGRVTLRGGAFYRSPSFLSSTSLPVFGFLATWFYVRRRQRLDADPRIGRFRVAGRDARRALAALARAGADTDGFYDDLMTTMRSYLAAKLDLPPGAVERGRVRQSLDGSMSADGASDKLEELFELAERVRYAGSHHEVDDRRAAVALAREIVQTLERDRSLERRLGFAAGLTIGTTGTIGIMGVIGIMAIVLAAGPAGVVGTASADEDSADPYSLFFEANAAYEDGRYDAAAEVYEAIVSSASESGAIYFNLGNAYFKAGSAGRALLNYERARMRLPRDPDVLANLSYAREQVEQESIARPPWQRSAFTLADATTTGELAMAAALLWWSLWAFLTARLLFPVVRLGLARATALTVVVLGMVGASLVLRLATVELRPRGVVVAAGLTVVRYEPSESGVEYFEASEGSILMVTDERDGWLQIRRSDGLRGWIPSAAVVRI